MSVCDRAALLPLAPGVYRFRDAAGRVLYLARMVQRITRVEAVVCASAHEAAWLERNLLTSGVPRWNRAPRAPGCRSFGPYLGGKQVRLAVSGLSRLLPLPYAAADLGGTNQDLARIRGVSAVDREALAVVLDHDPPAVTAVRGQLIKRRDAAAADLGFELAGRLQQEITALDWVTAPQQVTRLAPADHGGVGAACVPPRAGKPRARPGCCPASRRRC